MIAAALLVLAAAQEHTTVNEAPRPLIALREEDGELVVDAHAAGVDPVQFLRALASAASRTLEGEDLVFDRAALDVELAGRPIESVLDLIGHATRTRIAIGRRAITIAPERAANQVDERRLDAESAWVSIVRDFPEHEVARVARIELGRRQESLGQEDAALTHYDAATRTTVGSPAVEEALAAAGDLLMRRQEWNEAMRRFSRLAQSSASTELQVRARLALARALAELGRGSEALALVDVVELSYPSHAAADVAERRLFRARAHLASGSAANALRELDLRAASDPRLGGLVDDLNLRARALEELQAPLEAARAWLACASVATEPARGDALVSAARLAASGGDDLAVLFVERLAQSTPRAAEVARFADASRTRLGVGPDDRDLAALELRWLDRARLAPADRAQLAADVVAATARERGADQAANFARTALLESDGSDARTIRRALAIAYEHEGAWAEAARAWGGTAP